MLERIVPKIGIKDKTIATIPSVKAKGNHGQQRKQLTPNEKSMTEGAHV